MRSSRSLSVVLVSSLMAAVAVAIFIESVKAAPVMRFVSAGGMGVTCSRPTPCALQTALGQALVGDSVYVGAGTYTGVGSAVVTLTKSITLYGGWDGAAAGPIIRNPSVYESRIDAQNLRRGVYIGGDITPTLDGFTVMHGNATGLVAGCSAATPGGCGGGIFVLQSHVRILNNIIISNTALVTSPVYAQGHGGGVYLQDISNALLSGNLIFNNVANASLQGNQGAGGGIQVEADGYNLVIQSNQIISNSAPDWGGGVAILSHAIPSISRNELMHNSSLSGAGIYEWTAGGSIQSNLVSNNTGGEAVYLGFSTALLAANTIISNAATTGVTLIYGSGSGTRVNNNIIARNGGTGIFATGPADNPLTATLQNNTLVGSGYGQAIFIPSIATARMQLTNTLVSGFATAFRNNSPTTTLTARNTLLDGGVAQGNATAVGVIQGSPAFLDPAHGDYHIGANSAARDAGYLSLLSIDIDGDPRPLGPATDIGADETIYDHALFLPLIMR